MDILAYKYGRISALAVGVSQVLAEGEMEDAHVLCCLDSESLTLTCY